MDFSQIIITVLLNGVGVLIAAYILPGVHVKGFGSALITGILLSILNATLWWVFAVLSLPLIILTLGLFILVINTAIVMLVDKLLDGFKVDSFFWALIFSILLALINALLKWIFM